MVGKVLKQSRSGNLATRMFAGSLSAGSVEIGDALGIIVVNNEHVIQDANTDQALDNRNTFARSREWITFLHIHEVEEVRYMRLRQAECLPYDRDVRTSFGHDEKTRTLIERTDEIAALSPPAIGLNTPSRSAILTS